MNELEALIERVEEEIRIFDRPSANNSKKMLEYLKMFVEEGKEKKNVKE